MTEGGQLNDEEWNLLCVCVQSWYLTRPSPPVVAQIFPDSVMYFLSNIRTFCIISFTDNVDLGAYCEILRTYCVRFCTNVAINSKAWKTRAFHWFNRLIPRQTIYALLLLISKCRKLDVFWRNFFVSKLCLCISFYNYQVCVCVLFCKHHQKCKCHQWYQCLKVSIESIKNNVTNSHFPKFNPNFRQQGLMLGDHFYRWTHHNISFCFGVTAIWAHKGSVQIIKMEI